MAVRRTRHGRRDLAVLLLGFALAARRSELRLLDWTDCQRSRKFGSGTASVQL
ncbi:hypothetical protein [Streptomyces sp. NPDC001312]|uniref:hypothetical protein n=1 Tax=Streptomyces sp. NPDC001312 TaxID=3364561 RepID=UPI003698EA52